MQVERLNVRVLKLSDNEADEQLKSTSPAQRLSMMWQLTIDAWAFKGEAIPDFEPNVVRVIQLVEK